MTADLEHLKAIWLELRAQVDELAAERQQYLDFFEQSPEAYVVTDPLGKICEVNGAAVDILQRRKRYLRDKPFAVLVALEERAVFRRRLRQLTEANGAERSWRTTVLTPETRMAVTLKARVMRGAQRVGGICWLLQTMQ